MDQFAQEGLAELRDDAPHLGMVGEGLDVFEDLQEESLANLWNPLRPFCHQVPFPSVLQVTKR
jgi:hypothetical protein